MPPPTRPVSGAPIAVAWGQYVHDTIVNQQKAVVAVSATADAIALAGANTWTLHDGFTGADKWDGGGFHSPTFNPHSINLGIPGLWEIFGAYQVTCGTGEHLHWAGVSYGAGVGSAPLAKDQRSERGVVSTSNRFQFGPWYVVSSGGGGSEVELWIASSHASGTELVDGVNNGSGELIAKLVAIDLT